MTSIVLDISPPSRQSVFKGRYLFAAYRLEELVLAMMSSGANSWLSLKPSWRQAPKKNEMFSCGHEEREGNRKGRPSANVYMPGICHQSIPRH